MEVVDINTYSAPPLILYLKLLGDDFLDPYFISNVTSLDYFNLGISMV